ncbi:lasso peptide biosynthesis B2 protein [Uniformispora flossi]|uniref:lasso peptide biosynthesis B2 protein n=1 Tax=Uniformispora flossi TaxID=3390723 RepID=UPI003C305191
MHYQEGADGGLVILDASSGQWSVLNAGGAAFWAQWAAGRGLDDSIAAVAAAAPGVPRERVAADALALHAELTGRGLVSAAGAASAARGARAAAPARISVSVRTSTPTSVSAPAQTPEPSMPPIAPAPAPAPAPAAVSVSGERAAAPRGPGRLMVAAAAVALLGAVLLVRLPFAAQLRVVRATRGRWCRTAEPVCRAEHLLAAVQSAARRFPGRAACLEASLAAVLLAAVRRRRLDWCLGAFTDPYRFHAWVESGGVPVGLPGAAEPGPGEMFPVRVLAV